MGKRIYSKNKPRGFGTEKVGKRKESGLKRIVSFPGLEELSQKFISGEISQEEFQDQIENLEPEYIIGSLKSYDDMPDINESSRE